MNEVGSENWEAKRLQLDERRLTLEESWPRKWGTVVVSAAATISVALITGALGALQQCSAKIEQAKAARIEGEQRARENNRTALDMYFRYVADKPNDAPRRQEHIKVIQAIASDPGLLRELGAQQTLSAIGARPAGQAPSEAVSGLPDVKSQPAKHLYRPSDFIAYVQYFAPRTEEAGQVADALRALGLKVPAQEAMPAEKSPARNEIRIYRAEHAPFAKELAERLRATGLTFEIKQLHGQLPNGVIEIWLGRSAAPAP